MIQITPQMRLLVAVEPGRRSIDCAGRIFAMAEQIGLRDVRVVANKVSSPADEEYVRAAVAPRALAGCIPLREEIRLADRDGRGIWESCTDDLREVFQGIIKRIEETNERKMP